MRTYHPKADLELSCIEDTDSYKFSHYLEYPEGMDVMFSYFESRGGEFPTSTLFGLQVFLHRYLSKRVRATDVDEAEAFAREHGVPFYREGWMHLVEKYDGRWPVRIRAVPEGTIVPPSNVLMTVESPRDTKCFWIPNWLETMLSRVWYPSTIASMSREVKKVWKQFLELSSDNPEAEIGFKHHDFGSRGVTCREQAMLGGAAHLLSFLGSDTVAGIKCANHYYDEKMAGFSIPATEHSTMTVWGRSREKEAVLQWIRKTLVERELPPGVPKLTACVGDSYDIYGFVRMLCEPDVQELIKSSGGTFVIRPDSGDPIEVMTKILAILDEYLDPGEIRFNSKKYLVLPDHLRIIWGDGINRRSMVKILRKMTDLGWSASNFAFGSGGGLLMDCNRDTQKFAFKCSFAQIDGKSVDVVKDPITDPGKRSKAGRLDLVRDPDGTLRTLALPPGVDSHPDSAMVTVFDCGDITYHTTFEEIRKRMAI